jgi:hypothetical protein
MTGQDGMGLLGWAGQTGCSPRLPAPVLVPVPALVSGGRMGRLGKQTGFRRWARFRQ